MCELFSLHSKPAVMQKTINSHLVDTLFLQTRIKAPKNKDTCRLQIYTLYTQGNIDYCRSFQNGKLPILELVSFIHCNIQISVLVYPSKVNFRQICHPIRVPRLTFLSPISSNNGLKWVLAFLNLLSPPPPSQRKAYYKG